MAELSNGPNAGLKITALSVPDVVRVLNKAGARTVTEASIRADLAAGAPSNPDDTINLINFAAWIARELARHDN